MTRLSLLLASAGGGSSGYGGGGGGGGGGYSGGGGSGGGGPWWLWIAFALAAALFVMYGAFTAARVRKRRRARVAHTRMASFEAAEDDPYFAADDVTAGAARLFRDCQQAWDGRDRERLAQLVGDDLMVEWRRRLDDFDAKGWHNEVEVESGPDIEYVGLVNRADDSEDRVVVRVTAAMRDVVVTGDGSVVTKSGSDSEVVALAEYWTLARRGDAWTVVSIEQDAEGAHNLDAPLVPSPWSDDERVRDDARVELAKADAAPAGTDVAALVDLDFADDARKAALDLSLVDDRYSPDVLEAAARRAVAGWAEAVDGDDDALEQVADPAAVHELLHPSGDKSRLVVRGPRLDALRIVALDKDALVVEAKLSGRRYVEDRDTLALLAGSRDTETSFTERWRLALDGAGAMPWRIAAVMP